MDMYRTFSLPANPKSKGFGIAGAEADDMTDDQTHKAALVERACRLDDEAAFDGLFKLYVNQVYSIAYSILLNKEDAEDVVQAVFVNAHKSRKEARDFGKWLCAIAFNISKTAFNRRKRKQWREGTSTDDDDQMQGITPVDQRCESDPERALFLNEINREIRRAIKGLRNKKQQLCCWLAFVEHKDSSEIAELVGSKKNTVSSWICKGWDIMRPRLRVLMEDELR